MIKPELMGLESFSNIIDILEKEKFRLVYLYQSGEPFLNPEIYSMISYIAISGMDSSLATRLNAKISFNDLEFSLKQAQKFKHTVEFLVTIDSFNNPKEISPGINRELVISNLEELAKLQKYKSAKFLFSSVVTKANENELDDVENKIKTFGFKLYAPMSMCYYMSDSASPEDLNTIKAFIPDNPKFRNRLDVVADEIVTPHDYCNNIMPTIGVNGHVTICCHDMLHKLDMGDVLTEGSLRKIISKPEYLKTIKLGRRFKLDMCRGCS